MPTFAEAAATVVEQKRAGWRSPRQTTNWLHSLERYVLPTIGSRPVSEVSSADVLAVLTPIWHVKSNTARCLRHASAPCWSGPSPWSTGPTTRATASGRCSARSATSCATCGRCPIEVAAALEKVRGSRSTRAVKLAFEFLVVTAARSGEVRLARWEEIDLARRVWTIPAERMKMRREHRVPLSVRAVEVLDAARSLADGNPLVFPNRLGNPVRDTFLSQLLKDLTVAAVPHGFRSSFRDWAAEADHPREVIEARWRTARSGLCAVGRSSAGGG